MLSLLSGARTSPKNLHFEIKTAKAEAAELKSVIEKAAADITAAESKIGELSGTIATDEADLKAATALRKTEAADFAAEEQELTQTIDALDRASSILERELKAGASFVQFKDAASHLVQSLGLLVEASAINTVDKSKLSALLQSQQETEQESDDNMGLLGAPDPAAYESKSGGILEVLTDMLGKAEDQLAEARKTETTSKHNFELMKQTLEDPIKFANKELEKTKKKRQHLKSIAKKWRRELRGLSLLLKSCGSTMQRQTKATARLRERLLVSSAC